MTQKGLVFQSPTYSDKKYPYVAKAECQIKPGGHLTAIDPDCTCGFYSFKQEYKAWTYNGIKSQIVAEIVNSGAFVEYSEGYRSEIQRVKTVLVRECHSYNHNYDVEAVGIIQDGNELKGACFTHLQKHMGAIYSFDEVQDLFVKPQDTNHRAPKVRSTIEATPLTTEEVKKLRKSIRHSFPLRVIQNEIVLISGSAIIALGGGVGLALATTH